MEEDRDECVRELRMRCIEAAAACRAAQDEFSSAEGVRETAAAWYVWVRDGDAPT